MRASGPRSFISLTPGRGSAVGPGPAFHHAPSSWDSTDEFKERDQSGSAQLSSIRILPEGKKLKAKTLIAGFHGIGATGYWSVKFLIDEVKAKRAFYIDSEFAPAVSSTLNKSISTPYEVFASGKVAFLKADVPPLRENEARFFRELGDWILQSGVD